MRQTTSSAQSDVLEDTTFSLDKMEMMLSSDFTAVGGSGLREFPIDPLYQLTRIASSENGAAVERSDEYVNDFNLGPISRRLERHSIMTTASILNG